MIGLRFEDPEFQQRIMKAYGQLKSDSYWKEIDGDKPFHESHGELMTHCCEAINKISVNDQIGKLW